jgi:hypothetical protein
LKDVVVQATFEALWKKLGKIIERLGRLVKLYAKHPPQGWNMIKFRHNELQVSHKKTFIKGYDGANVLKWNLQNEPFVVR